MISKVLQLSMTGPTVLEFVQQGSDPNRYAVFASRYQFGRCWRSDDAGQATALAPSLIAPSVYCAPVGLDLNLQNLGVFGSGEEAKR